MQSPHPHDLPPDEYEAALRASDWPALLEEVVRIARASFGFFTRHVPHAINYAWAASKLQELPAGATALDVGSGVSPLPIFLARRGVTVDCVDHSTQRRSFPVQDDWNEWGFFDYSIIDPKLTSQNCDILAFSPSHKYDLIYSVCSLAHMPKSVQEQALRQFSEWLKEGGTLVLVVDLLPGTDFIWNIRGNDEFEPRDEHGTIGAVRRQLAELGCQIEEAAIKRNVHHSRTDLAFLVARKTAVGVCNVFSFWDQPDLTPIAPFVAEWRSQFPNFTILGDPDIGKLIEELFPEDLALYRSLRIPTCKSDIAILLGLYKYGGLYIDCHCGISDGSALFQLLACKDDWELILYDKRRDLEHRAAGELFPLNSVLIAKANSPILREAAANAFRNLRAHRQAEQRRGFVPYDIWELTGPGNLADTILVPGAAVSRVRPEYQGRIRFLPEGPGEPITRYAHDSYRVPGMHWSERQQREPLFVKSADPRGFDPYSAAAYREAMSLHLAQVAPRLRHLDEAIARMEGEQGNPDRRRLQTMRVILESGLFDLDMYVRAYPDVRDSGMDALDHYVRHGDAEGRSPNPVFLPLEYRRLSSPPLAPERNALQHYIEEGEPAGRNANRMFDPRAYLDANPRLREFVDHPLFHFLKFGQPAGLATRPLGEPAGRSIAGRRQRLRIAAHLGVKDEVEVIERVIAHLRAIGVDHIIACDMESTDGTAEILARYRSDDFWVLTLPNRLLAGDDPTWDQRNLKLIRDVPADWVMFLDADEFWLPASGDIKDCEALSLADALLVPRYNVPLGPDGPLMPDRLAPPAYDELLVIAEGTPDFSSHLRGHPETPWIRGAVRPKIMARRERIAGWSTGAHDLVTDNDPSLRWATPADLLIAHMPLSSMQRFSRRLENIAEIFADQPEDLIDGDGAWAADAWHWRRWLSLARQGRLGEEFERNIFSGASLAELRRSGVVRSAAEMLARRAGAG